MSENGEAVTSRAPCRANAWSATPVPSQIDSAPTNLIQPSLLGEDGDVAVISCAAYLDGTKGQILMSQPFNTSSRDAYQTCWERKGKEALLCG